MKYYNYTYNLLILFEAEAFWCSIFTFFISVLRIKYNQHKSLNKLRSSISGLYLLQLLSYWYFHDANSEHSLIFLRIIYSYRSKSYLN